ncbi:MAG: protein tyrosine phosphatase [Planctomycetota bacterium]|nr:protein tyrosine phosphatase [Planctomycetota bacterium]
MTARINLLFVCSRNKWRNPTAERMYRNDARFVVRSCGLSDRSPRQLRETDLTWADVVFAMETKHRARILGQFREAVGDTPLHVLDIPDDYEFMNPELVDLLRDRVEWHFLEKNSA